MRRYRRDATTFRDGFTMLSTDLANDSKAWMSSRMWQGRRAQSLYCAAARRMAQ
jgi:hypothetical protein